VVERQWRIDEVAKRLSEKARGYVSELDAGTPLATVAAAAGQPAKTAEGLTRGVAQGELSTAAVAQIFSIVAGKAGSAAIGDGDSRIVFKVEAATLAPVAAASPEAKQLDQQIQLVLSDDLILEYVGKLQSELGVKVNQQALRNALGGDVN
jgi:peptidyl-prolyl cis-trans isomerase D